MSLRAIRSLFETRINNAYQSLTVPVPVAFDNVGEEPPGEEYVILSLSYTSFAEPQLCPSESLVEYIKGNVQLVCYTPRQLGMARLEELAAVGMRVLNTIKVGSPSTLHPSMGEILGPTPVLTGNSPKALVNLSASFTVRVSD